MSDNNEILFKNELLREYADWDKISKYEILSDEFICEFADYLNWEIMFESLTISIDIIKKCAPPDFIVLAIRNDWIKYEDIELKWSLMNNEDLEIYSDLIPQHYNQIDWDDFCKCENVMVDSFAWSAISKYGILTDEFILENRDAIDWSLLFQFNKLSNTGITIARSIPKNWNTNLPEIYCDDVPESKEIPSIQVIIECRDYIDDMDLDWACITCYFVESWNENNIPPRELSDYLNWQVISLHIRLMPEYAHNINWYGYWTKFDEDNDEDYDELITEFARDAHDFVIENVNTIDWISLFEYDHPKQFDVAILVIKCGKCNYLNKYDFNQLPLTYGGNRLKENVESIQREVKHWIDISKQIADEMIIALHHPKYIKKWIRNGNDIEDYLI